MFPNSRSNPNSSTVNPLQLPSIKTTPALMEKTPFVPALIKAVGVHLATHLDIQANRPTVCSPVSSPRIHDDLNSLVDPDMLDIDMLDLDMLNETNLSGNFDDNPTHSQDNNIAQPHAKSRFTPILPTLSPTKKAWLDAEKSVQEENHSNTNSGLTTRVSSPFNKQAHASPIGSHHGLFTPTNKLQSMKTNIRSQRFPMLENPSISHTTTLSFTDSETTTPRLNYSASSQPPPW